MGQIVNDNTRVCQIPPFEKKSELWQYDPGTIMMSRDFSGSWRSSLFFLLAGVLFMVQVIFGVLGLAHFYFGLGYFDLPPIPYIFSICAISMFIGAWFSRPGGSAWYKDYVRNRKTQLDSTTENSFTRETTNIASFWGLLGVSLAVIWVIPYVQGIGRGQLILSLPQTLGLAGVLVGVLAVIISLHDHKSPPD